MISFALAYLIDNVYNIWRSVRENSMHAKAAPPFMQEEVVHVMARRPSSDLAYRSAV